MANGVLVRTLDELKENWDLEKVLNYYLNGKLLTWLNDRYYTELAEEVSALNGINDNGELQKKLCSIFGIEAEADLVDMEAVAERNRRLEILRQYTADDAVLKNVDKVAFNQEELADLLDEDEDVIYLFNNTFSIPLAIHNKTYIGIGNVEAVINTKKYINLDDMGIKFSNVKFNKEFNYLLNEAPERNFALGKEYENKKDYLNAYKHYKIAAEGGNAEALNALGDLYFNGNGVEESKEKAVEYFKLAIDKGNITALGNLGVCYICAYGTAKNV